MEAEIARRRGELRAGLAAGRAELEALRGRPLLDERERREVHELALRGELGRGMQRVAEDVAGGRADWEQVLRGEDPRHRHELEDFVERARAEHGQELAEVFARTPAPPDVDDPRREPPGKI